jgi:dTDP-glucose 4,6-dehydratase
LRVLISGGAGFIASHLSDRLLADGHEIVAIDNFLTGREDNIEHLRSNPRYEFTRHDVSIPFTVDGHLDYVYHMASPASPFDYLGAPIETMMVGSAGTKNLLDIALRHRAKYLLASTSECYGDPLEHPQKETYWGHVNPVGPRSVYDEAKRFAEALTMAYHRTYGLKSHIVRIFNTYGPRMKLNDGRVVPAFLDQALHGKPITMFGDGSQTRSFCYVSDLVEGLMRLIESDEPYPVNIGNPNEITILEFAERIQRLVGSDCAIEFHPLPKDDPKQRRPDISKARALLNWEPRVPLEEGLRLTIEYFRARELAPAAD